MSNAFAIPGVTAVLQYFLSHVYNRPNSVLSNVKVTAVAPDILQAQLGVSSDEQMGVNLFLHQVTANAAWRNMDLPSLGSDGGVALTNHRLALDLHYLLTAYAHKDSQAEAVLSHAVFLLHQNPILPRSQIRAALRDLNTLNKYTDDYANALRLSGLAEQIELIKITPETLGREEMAWLWTALKADYRLTFPFQVSVVLVEPQNPLSSALPVLQRSGSAQPDLLFSSPTPTLTSVKPPNGQPAACLGDQVTVQGYNLAGATTIQFTSARLGIEQPINLAAPVSGERSFQFTIPAPDPPKDPSQVADLPAGVYVLTVQVTSGSDTVTTNGIPLAIAPQIDPQWDPGKVTPGTEITIPVSCAPYVRPGQQAFLLIGDQAAPMDPFPTVAGLPVATNSPTFTFPTLRATTAAVPVRLRVDGIDSPFIDMTATPPAPPVFSGFSLQVQ